MVKFLVVALVVGIVVWLLAKGRGRQGLPRKPASRPEPAQPMVRCQHCGIHLPRGDAVIAAGDRYFCSEDHRRLGGRAS